MNNRIASVTLALLVTVAQPQGQYFGRNKVQYQHFDFKEWKTDNFNIFFYPEETDAVRDAGVLLERWNARYIKVFDRKLRARQPVILYADQADFQQTNAISSIIPQEMGGVTEGLLNRVVIPLTGINSENDHVLGHELTHAFQYDLMKNVGPGGLTSAQQVPLWFMEGMAEYLSIGPQSPLTSMWMRDAVLNNDIPSFDKIGTSQRYFPYRYGHAIWAYIGGRWGDQSVSTLMTAVLKHGWTSALKNVLRMTPDSLSKVWCEAIAKQYAEQLKSRTAPSNTGTVLIDKSIYNMTPQISPDGKYMVFLSTQDIFSIHLFLADATTGRIIRKLVKKENDRDFDAVRLFNSAGSWSPDSKQYAAVVFKGGDNAIAVFGVGEEYGSRLIKIPGVGEVTSIAWSPDGTKMALSGSRGGVSDLYLYDLRSSKLSKLTNDKYSDLQPSWSPDGRLITFITDRGPQTDLDALHYGPMKTAILDIEKDSVSLVSTAPWATHVNPLFGPGGRSLYFISNPDGFSDIYRYDLDSGATYRVTKTATGVSGITELSPAMSISKAGKLVFSVFDKGGFKIMSLDHDKTLGEPFTVEPASFVLAVTLPPVSKIGSIVTDYLDNSSSGFTYNKTDTATDYRPRLNLLYVGQLYAGVAADRFGAGVGGGASFLFSDILGDHILGIGAQINGGLKDLGGEMFYLNNRYRINGGFLLGHIPYLASYVGSALDTIPVDGQLKQVARITIVNQRTFMDRMHLIFTFPLSTNRRLEFTGGYTRISYSNDAEVLYAIGDNVVSREKITVPPPSGLDLVESALAYVGDFAYDGLTGPVKGRRYRFEADPVVGTINFVSALADYRQYLFLHPFTIAIRGFHYGRYLNDGDNERLAPLFIGYETWVRGYSAYSYDFTKCNGNIDQCPEFNRLTGSRIAVVNAEFRIPLLGTEQFGLIKFPYVPAEIAAFIDGGAAWNKGNIPELKWERSDTAHVPVFSAGGAARFNLFGFMVLQFYYAYPFQRPSESWKWGLLIAPGY